jgi:hypothetical protein
VRERFFLRANFWPATTDDADRNTGASAFLYGSVHDHNFNFLTSGYAASGYESDFYTYEHHEVYGYPGEHVPYRFVKRRLLGLGDIFLYRSHLDIHRQLPPQRMSISLNILDQTPQVFMREQYIFDHDTQTISNVVNRRCPPAFFEAAAQLLGDRALEPLLAISKDHDSEFVRAHALRAAHLAASDKTKTADLLSVALQSGSPVIREWCREQLGGTRSLFVG